MQPRRVYYDCINWIFQITLYQGLTPLSNDIMIMPLTYGAHKFIRRSNYRGAYMALVIVWLFADYLPTHNTPNRATQLLKESSGCLSLKMSSYRYRDSIIIIRLTTVLSL